MTHVPEVLFVCVHNAGRSQMAAALLAHHAAGAVVVRSAGSAPADSINPAVREAMAEIGIDLADATPKKLTTDAVEASDVVITMGCGDACPVFPGKRYLDSTTQQILASPESAPSETRSSSGSSSLFPNYLCRTAEMFNGLVGQGGHDRGLDRQADRYISAPPRSERSCTGGSRRPLGVVALVGRARRPVGRQIVCVA
jgi:protein-tyrosine-phosphatase